MPGEAAVLRFAKLTENAYAPSRGSELAAGYDLKSAYDYTIPACGKELVKTDLQIQLPEGCYGRVAPRSGLAWKHHIDVGAGVIDADYTGNLGIVMFNHGREDFKVKAGDRVAQLICEKICYPAIQEVKVFRKKMASFTVIIATLTALSYAYGQDHHGITFEGLGQVIVSDSGWKLVVHYNLTTLQVLASELNEAIPILTSESVTETTRGAGGFGSTGKN